MKNSAQSNTAIRTETISLFKSSKDDCKNMEPNKFAMKEKMEISNQNHHYQIMLMNLAVYLMINLSVNQRMMTNQAVDLMIDLAVILMMTIIL